MLHICVYQVNQDKDEKAVAFLSLDMLEKFSGSKDVDPKIYEEVFEGVVPCNDLEDVFRMFNLEKPEGYEGRSLSVSDVVGIIDENGETHYHYCDSIGFKKIKFDA